MATAESSVKLLAGPQLLGFCLSWALQGILNVQIYLYYLWFPRDPLATKLLVSAIFIYEWIQTVLVTQTAFEIDVYDFGDRTALTAFHNTWFSVTIMCAVISAVVQGYFSWRIWILSRSKLLPAVIICFSFAQMSVGVAGGVMLHVIDPTAAEASAVTPVISSWLAGAAFVDLIIALSMTYHLTRSKSGIKKTDDLVNRLVRLVVETGTLTATVAIVDLVCFTAIPNTLLHECPALVLAKLYSNTILVSLNNRAFLRHGGDNFVDSAGVTLQIRGYQSGTDLPQSATAVSNGGQPTTHKRMGVSHDEVCDIVLKDTESSDGNLKAPGEFELARMG
ncbi:hypothetical protein OH77DRAFT_1263959 [Trametes cingulata]|nr:hypothetical protein OH77DRAFT_1263959 [Trametes cingulata]